MRCMILVILNSNLMVLWKVTLCSLADRCKHAAKNMLLLSLKQRNDGVNRLPQNVSASVPKYMASHPRTHVPNRKKLSKSMFETLLVKKQLYNRVQEHNCKEVSLYMWFSITPDSKFFLLQCISLACKHTNLFSSKSRWPSSSSSSCSSSSPVVIVCSHTTDRVSTCKESSVVN